MSEPAPPLGDVAVPAGPRRLRRPGAAEMWRRLVTRVIQTARADPHYEVHPELSASDLVSEVSRRAISLVRSQWALRGVAGGRMRFVEEGCEVRHRRHCRIGSGSVLEAFVRLHCLSRDGVRIGERVVLGRFCVIECTGVLWHMGRGVRIGDGSSLSDFTFVGGSGGVDIGARVLMGQRVSIHSQNHNYDDPHRPIAQQGTTEQGVVIGDDCWIGSGSIILDGVTLGSGCVVAAGAVVTRSFPPNSVVAGVPARVVKTRGAPDEG